MSAAPLLLVAAAAQVAGLCCAWRWPRIWLGTAVISSIAAFAAAAGLLAGKIELWDWSSPWPVAGDHAHLLLDGVSAFFLALLAVLSAAGAVYARSYWSDRHHPCSACRGRFWWSVLVLSLGLVTLCSNGLHFLVAWELFTIAAYFLVTLERSRAEVRAAGWLYLAASHVGMVCLFAFFGSIAARTGSWDLGPMRDQPGLAPLFWLALAGFGVKAGVFPLHVWLPSAHANAPSHVSAILSGVTIKMGIYGLVRFTGWLPVPTEAGSVIACLGVLSAVLGVAFALGQHDLKRLLAYHSVENIGIILIGLGFALVADANGAPAWGLLAFAGGLLHVWNHGLFKALLFLGAGSVLHATGTREMSQLGGLWRRMPWTAGLFALGAAAISGLPPLNGFISEWLIYIGLFDAVNSPSRAVLAALPAIILLAITGALALACFVKACSVVFLGAARTKRVERAHESPWGMRAPMLVLAAGCVTIGLAPVVFWPALMRAASAWQPAWTPTAAPPALMILGGAHIALAILGTVAAVWLWRRAARAPLRRSLTWDCGYHAPTARMQYTAGSFARTITEWFAAALRPQRHAHAPEGIHPHSAGHEEHTPETVLEKIIHPIATVVMRVSAATRSFQHGRLQAYLVYLLFAVAALATFAFAQLR